MIPLGQILMQAISDVVEKEMLANLWLYARSVVGRDPWLIILTHLVNNIDRESQYTSKTSIF